MLMRLNIDKTRKLNLMKLCGLKRLKRQDIRKQIDHNKFEYVINDK